jgi:UDP-N-acetylmuramoyl-tripeptide--D-alanyl-D-alanine ligase
VTPRIDHAPLRVRAARIPLLWALRRVAWLALRRHRPVVVGVTGSVGKTTTKELIAELVQRHRRTWATPASASGELGAALTVLGVRVVRVRWREWAAGFLRGVLVLAMPRSRYPDVLVIEMAAGRPGELRRMTRSIRPDIAVVLNVRRTHIEHFRTLDAIAHEKAWLVRRLQPGGTAILNADDERVAAMAGLCEEHVVLVGCGERSELRAERVETGAHGIAAEVRVDGRAVRVESPLLGAGRVGSVLATLAVARALGIPEASALDVIARFGGPPGRLRPLRARAGVTIIDDAYSASPDAVLHALDALGGCEGPHRAVLGELPQLGPGAAGVHREIGRAAGGWLADLVAVGDGGRAIAAGAIEAGMDPERVRWAADAEHAAPLVAGFAGGTVLVTGSHALLLERAFRDLLLDPDDPAALDRSSPAPPTRRPVPVA